MVAITPEEGMQSSLILANRIKDTVAGKRVVISDDFVTSIIFFGATVIPNNRVERSLASK